MKKEFNDTESIEDVLRSLIEEHGKDLYKKENTFRLKSFLSDFAVKFPKERKFLNVVLDEGIQEKLLSIDNGSNDDKHYVVASCCLRLTEDIGFTENRAMEALDILAIGLGWDTPLSKLIVEQSDSKQDLSTTPAIEVSDSLGKTYLPSEKKDDKYDVQNTSFNQWQNTQQQSKKKSVNKSRKFYTIGIVILAIIFLAIGILKNRVNITHTNGVTNVSLNTQKLPYIEVGKDEKFKTLKKAILFIEEGGTIVLKPGVYTGSININKKLKLVGIRGR